jgi:hypothetical protein
MVPKKSNKIYQIVSEDLNIQGNLVEDIVQFYYKELRSKMSSLSHTRINVEGLGHMIVKSKIVKKAITRYEKGLVNHDTSTYNAYHNKRSMEEKLILLKEVAQKLDKDLEERKQFNQLKNESSTESNMGEQESNS